MQWARVVGPPAWGWMADHVKGRQGVARLIQFSAIGALACSLLLLTDLGFWPLFMALCVMSFFLSGQVPITESLALQASHGSLKGYGRMRVWGSIGFIVAVVVAGPWFDAIGIAHLPASVIGMLCLVFMATLWLPHREVHDLSPEPALLKNILRDRRVQMFLSASFLMLLAHAPLYTLFSLWLHEQGFNRTQIGLFWGLAVIAEIVMFQSQHHFFERFSIKACWIASFVITAVRFAMVAGSGGSVLVIAFAQVLHAVTFGVHHSATMSLIRQWFPAQAQARGQALYTMASYGLGGSLGGIAAGWLYEAVSPEFAFAAAAGCAVLGALVALGAVLADATCHQPPPSA